MIDIFKTHARTLISPPEHAVEITPSDAQELEYVTRAVYVGDTGDLVLRIADGAVITLANVPTGTFLPLRVRQVLAAGTTAAALVGFW